MKADSKQTVSDPSSADRERLEKQRAVVRNLIAEDPANLRKFATAAGKLGTIRAILEARAFKPGQTYELQCLGIVLGDAFVLELGLEWVMVEDQSGRDPALRLPGTSIMLFPLTMIGKRVEKGEAVDVFELFNGLAAQVEEQKKAGR